MLSLLNRSDSEIKVVLGPGLACRADRLANSYGKAAWQSTHRAHQAALESLAGLAPVLSPYRIIRHPYGDYVYIGDDRETCRELLESFVLEPGLTGEYR